MSIYEWLNEWSAWGWPLLARHLWQATLFSGLIFVLAVLFKRAPARARYTLWLIASVKFLVPSVLFIYLFGLLGLDLTALSNLFHASAPVAMPVTPQVAGPVIQFAETAMMSSVPDVPAAASHQGIYSLLTIVWLAGCAFLLGRWCVRHRRTVRSVRAGTVFTGERESRILERVRDRLRIKRRVNLISSHAVDEPGVWGIWKPVMLFPENLLACLGDEELETVMTHEMIHVKRWDNLTSHLQMLLCCAFWFHPLVWLLDSKLLAERERACDDEVLRLGGSSNIYAASLVKVSRFGLGLKTAGVSGAAGSHVLRRIERIMAPNVTRKLTLAHRLLMCSMALALVIFSIGAGLLGDAHARASSDSNGATFRRRAAVDDVEDRAAFIFNEVVSRDQVENVRDQLARAAEVSIQTENQDGAPLSIIEARVKVVPLAREVSGSGKAEEVVSPSTLRLSNRTGQRITFLRLSLREPNSWHDIVGFKVSIEPRGEYVLRPDSKKWMNTITPGNARSLIAQIIAVQFEDGSSWGDFDEREAASVLAPSAPVASDEQTPTPDATITGEVDGKYFPARFENLNGAPLIIVDAHSKAVAVTDDMLLIGASREACSLPVVTLSNVTGQRIVALKLRFKADAESHAVTAFRATIEPHGSFVFRRDSVMSGRPEQMRVQVLGVQFEDGSVWGSLDSTINARDAVIYVPNSISKAQPSNNVIGQPAPAAPNARRESTASEVPPTPEAYTPPPNRSRPESAAPPPRAPRARGTNGRAP